MLFPPVWENHMSQQPLAPLLGPKSVSDFPILSSSLKIAGYHCLPGVNRNQRPAGLNSMLPLPLHSPPHTHTHHGLLRFDHWLKQPTSMQRMRQALGGQGVASLRDLCQLFLFVFLCLLKHPQQATWGVGGASFFV